MCFHNFSLRGLTGGPWDTSYALNNISHVPLLPVNFFFTRTKKGLTERLNLFNGRHLIDRVYVATSFFHAHARHSFRLPYSCSTLLQAGSYERAPGEMRSFMLASGGDSAAWVSSLRTASRKSKQWLEGAVQCRSSHIPCSLGVSQCDAMRPIDLIDLSC